MKSRKYSAIAAFFGLGKRAPERKPETEAAKLARVSAETGVSVRSLALFSKIGEHKGFTADDAHKDFGAVKPKEVA